MNSLDVEGFFDFRVGRYGGMNGDDEAEQLREKRVWDSS
jgi:hypothetical protein